MFPIGGFLFFIIFEIFELSGNFRSQYFIQIGHAQKIIDAQLCAPSCIREKRMLTFKSHHRKVLQRTNFSYDTYIVCQIVNFFPQIKTCLVVPQFIPVLAQFVDFTRFVATPFLRNNQCRYFDDIRTLTLTVKMAPLNKRKHCKICFKPSEGYSFKTLLFPEDIFF